MIKSFKHKGLKRLYQKGDPSLIGANIRGTVEVILTMLDEAVISDDLDLPGYRLHPLKGPLKGFWSTTVNANWRIIFRLVDGNVYDVELIDYH
jgi:proteic killer suppression protein